jgi:hypothetical protein
VGIGEVDDRTKLFDPVVSVWWEGGFPEKVAVGYILPAGLNPHESDDDSAPKKEVKTMAAGAACVIGSASGQVSVVNEESD